MSYAVRRTDGDAWSDLKPWFESFIELAYKVNKAKSLGHRYKKILLAVPRSDMVSLALAIGFSKASHELGLDLRVPIELDEVDLQNLIQVRPAWDEHPEEYLLPLTTVGVVSGLERESGRLRLRLTFDSGALPTAVQIMASHSPKGEKDPLRHIRLFKVPEGTPQRPERPPSRRVLKPASIQNWESWEYQLDPTLAIFGMKSKIEDYFKLQFRDSVLHNEFLNLSSGSIEDTARLDRLTNDRKAHFINAVEQVSSFPTPGSPTEKTLGMFPFVCLDGNQALVSLSDEPILENKCVIGLWETGNQNYQEGSLQKFLEVASRNKALDNFEQNLMWKAPAGVQCWGWK